MIAFQESVLVNNDQSFQTAAGLFMTQQRNEGFAVNDGKWVLSQHGDLYRSTGGVLRLTADVKFLGVFDTAVDVVEAIELAAPLPARDHVVC